MNRNKLNEICDWVDATIAASGFECVECEWVAHDKILRIYVDSPGGVVLDDCARLSRELESRDEFGELISQAYHLEVSSPGIERPLRKLRDFVKFSGEEIELRARLGDDQRVKKLKGTIAEVLMDEKLVVIDSESDVWRIHVDHIQSAKLVPDWDNIANSAQ